MKPRLARAAWVGLVLMLSGWIVAVLGFMPTDETTRSLSPAITHAIRVFGFVLIVVGSTVSVLATVGLPVAVIVAGVALNLAHQAAWLGQESTGVAGAGLVLIGALWGSRKIRQLPS